MRVFFICGSLEPGRDGVGDYVQSLAGELTNQGHQVAVGAIYDTHLKEKFMGFQNFNSTKLEVLRIPSEWSVKRRFFEAKRFTENFKPDYISLQYVPFSFDSKGLDIGLGTNLKRLSDEGIRWHIMFHELWVGMDEAAPLKHVIWGKVQKQLVRSLIKILAPVITHTQSYLHQNQLAKIGCIANYLPLFSNIPRLNVTKGEVRITLSKTISFVVFGSIHQNAPIELMAAEASRYSQINGVQMCLTFLGICGPEQGRWIKIWEGNGLSVKVVGEQPAEIISCVLEESQFGISTTPIALCDKSGSVAAMLEHGLPIITVSKAWQPKGIILTKIPCNLFEYRKGNFAELIEKKHSDFKLHSLGDVARTFADELSLKICNEKLEHLVV